MESPVADGVLLVDKPAGVTSHDVVAVVRRAARTRRVGHAGTLDPFATGLLVLLLGRGTRLLPYVDGEPKVYEATIRFGVETDTDDLTGAVVREAALPESNALSEGMQRLTGLLDQVPPTYSAKKVAGTRAYATARRGGAVALAPVRVTVHAWEVLVLNGSDPLKERELHVRITCSGGTYIRALARDLGRLAGSAAHLTALRRTRSGPFDVRDAAPLDRLRDGEIRLLPLRRAIMSLPTQAADARTLVRIVHGNPIPAEVDGSRVALIDDRGDLVGVAERAGAELQPRLVLRDA